MPCIKSNGWPDLLQRVSKAEGRLNLKFWKVELDFFAGTRHSNAFPDRIHIYALQSPPKSAQIITALWDNDLHNELVAL